MGAGCSKRATDGEAAARTSDDDGDEEEPGEAARRWRRLVRALFRIRRLQRIFGHLGQRLQQIGSKGFREDLQKWL